ncbi:hypothetical protein D6779_02345 [Candidatus Parcubacteria bacterium]|nr:MAG: hypothetical protein D6779_02345 [Candidatus Parcubacteria bacterium]
MIEGTQVKRGSIMPEFRDPFADIKRSGRHPTRSRTAGSEAQQLRRNDQENDANQTPGTSPELKCYCPNLEQVSEELEIFPT